MVRAGKRGRKLGQGKADSPPTAKRKSVSPKISAMIKRERQLPIYRACDAAHEAMGPLALGRRLPNSQRSWPMPVILGTARAGEAYASIRRARSLSRLERRIGISPKGSLGRSKASCSLGLLQ